MSRKLIALILCLLMLTGSVAALAIKDVADNAMVFIKTNDIDFSGKTVIIHSNDVHGSLDGYAYMSACAQYVRNMGGEVILADAGDFMQGAPYVSLSKGHTAIEMMNAVGYDVATLGNHEFDYGVDVLMENIGDANFPIICANVTKDGEPLLPATTVIERGGVKIGFFGMETPETATKVNPNLLKGISFAPFEQLYEKAQAAVDSLKEQGVDLVIGLWHLGIDNESVTNGYRSTDVFEKVSGVDFVLDAHSHTVMTEDEHNNPIQSTGTGFATVGVVIIDNATKKIENNFLLPTKYLKKDKDVDAAAQAIISAVDDEYGSPFATTEVLLNGERDPGNRTSETNLGDLITDAMVWTVTREGGPEQDEIAGVVGVTNGGGIRASIQAGDVSMKDINTVLPFGNTVAVVYVKGSELLEALEASTFCTPNAVGGYPQTSGIEWTLDTTVEYDQGELYHNADGSDTSYYAPASIKRVTITAVNGEAFDPEAVYAVVTNNFCAAGGDTYNAFMRAYEEGSGFDTGIPMDQAVMNYVTDVLEGNITAEAYGEPRGNETQILAQ